MTACATPSRKRPTEGQVWVEGLPGIGWPMRRSTARKRIATAPLARRADGVLDVEREVYAARNDPFRVPGPTGLEFPHVVGSSRCDPEHPLWRTRDADLERAVARVSRRLPADVDDATYGRAVLEDLDRHAPQYRAAERDCVRGFERREEKRRGKATESTARTVARARSTFRARGGDVTSAEYADDVLGGLSSGRRRRRKAA